MVCVAINPILMVCVCIYLELAYNLILGLGYELGI